jgi:uroporphyrinogen decarboxylase
VLSPDNRLLRVLRGEAAKPGEPIPVWFMRQAGRYLPEYRALRERHDFLTLARTPELAGEITLQPVRRLGVDAAILFADILLPLLPMGAPFRFAAGEGPVFDAPLSSRADVERLRIIEGPEMAYVGETLRLVAQELLPETALIGFAGAPFTLASYLVEGGHSKDFRKVKQLMWSDPETFELLMGKLTETTIRYLELQIANGAQVVQLFDSWVGILSPDDYARQVLPHSRRILTALSSTPTLHFGVDTASLLPLMATAGATGLGVDWRLPLATARKLVPAGMPLQGNLDPLLLLAPVEVLLERCRRILIEGRSGPHIFNTGHGLVPETPPDSVKRVVDLVHAGVPPG